MSGKIILAGALVAAMAAAQAADFYPDMKVSSVTLYDGPGDVLRQGQLDIRETGTHRIWLSQPLAGNRGSDVLVTGAVIRSRSVRPHEQALQSNEAERIIAARVRLESTRRALEDNERQAEAWSKRLEHPEAKTGEIRTTLLQLAEEQKTLVHRHAEAERALARALALQEWQGDTQSLPLAVVLDVVVDKPGKVNISWREQSDQLFWQPALQVNLDSKTQRVRWQAEARIQQKSGLDLDDVTLHLALGAARDVPKPVFHPLTVRLAERHQLQERMLAAMDIPPFVRNRVDNEQRPAALPPGAGKEIRLPGHYSLESGGNQIIVTYQQGDAGADVYRAVYAWEKPQAALVMADFTLPETPAFVPGRMQLYRDGSLVAEREQYQPWRGGEAMSLSFGEDAQIRVRQQTAPDTRDSRNANSLEYDSSVEVSNSAAQTLRTRIYALLPVAGEKDIQVKPVWPQMPDEKDVDGVKGMVYWQKDLAAGESWTLRHGYSISYPQGKQVIGL